MKSNINAFSAALISLCLSGAPALAQDHDMPGADDHAHHSEEGHGGPHGNHGTDDGDIGHHDMDADPEHTAVALSRTPEIDKALAAGGEPVVADVLGVVCDFCAKAMNKTFGKRSEVAAVYVDLDNKTLNLVMTAGETLSNAEIGKLVKKAGYKLSAIRRGDATLASRT